MSIEKYLTAMEKAYKDFIRSVMETTLFRQLNDLAESVANCIGERLED